MKRYIFLAKCVFVTTVIIVGLFWFFRPNPSIVFADESVYEEGVGRIRITTYNETIAKDIIHRYEYYDDLSYEYHHMKQNGDVVGIWIIWLDVDKKQEILNSYK